MVERVYFPINEGLARLAKQMMSFDDYKEGSKTAEYKAYVEKAFYIVDRIAEDRPKELDRAKRVATTYSRRLADNMNRQSRIGTMCPSIMISGGSNFPVRKKEKKACDKEIIKAGDEDALMRLEEKISEREAVQELMKEVNAYFKKTGTLDNCPELTAEQIEKLKASQSTSWRKELWRPFESYQLSNNNAEINRLKKRLELRLKQDQLENFLWKVQSTVLPLDVVGAPQPLNYRNKVVYHTERRGGNWLLGYREEQSHRVTDVTEDPLACPEINKALPDIRAGVMALLTRGAKAVRDSAKAAANVTIRYTPIDGVKWWLGDPPLGMELTEQTCGLHFRVPADGFYQVNPPMADKLVATVRDAYLEGVSEAGHLLDLYCGVGVFGLCCLKALGGVALKEGVSARLVGIESVREAIACAKRNAEALGVKASFFCERVGGSLGRIKVGPHHTVVLDPPRGGLEPNVPGWLAKRPAPRLFYVSCDPATLTRDLTALMPTYRVEKATLFDLFPRTARFETFVQLVRK